MLIDEGLELLDEEQCRGLLESTQVGRVGVTIAGLPVILPVNYALVDGDVVFRAGEGTKLHAASGRAVIAFEVDAYDAARAHRLVGARGRSVGDRRSTRTNGARSSTKGSAHPRPEATAATSCAYERR